jgi:hypothetical protein
MLRIPADFCFIEMLQIEEKMRVQIDLSSIEINRGEDAGSG